MVGDMGKLLAIEKTVKPMFFKNKKIDNLDAVNQVGLAVKCSIKVEKVCKCFLKAGFGEDDAINEQLKM